MADSYNDYVGDGSNRLFSITFPYLNKDHVGVTVNGVAAPFTWQSATQILTDAAPAALSNIRLRRRTPASAPLVQFTASTLKDADLNTATRQSLYAAQELWDRLADAEAALRSYAENSGLAAVYATKAAANAALAGLAQDDVVEVSVDESRGSARTRYRVDGAAFVFLYNYDQLRQDLNTGSSGLGAELVKVDGEGGATNLRDLVRFPSINLRRYVATTINNARNMMLDTNTDTVVFDKSMAWSGDIAVPSSKRIIFEPKASSSLQNNAVALNSLTGTTGRVAKAFLWITGSNVTVEHYGVVSMGGAAWSGGTGHKHFIFAKGAHNFKFTGNAEIQDAFNGICLVDCDDFIVEGLVARYNSVGVPNAALEIQGCRRGRFSNIRGYSMEETVDFNPGNSFCIGDNIVGVNNTQAVVEINNGWNNEVRGILAKNCPITMIYDYPSSGIQHDWSSRYIANPRGDRNLVSGHCHIDNTFNKPNTILADIQGTNMKVYLSFLIESPLVNLKNALFYNKAAAYNTVPFGARQDSSEIHVQIKSDTPFTNGPVLVNDPAKLKIVPHLETPLNSTTQRAISFAPSGNYADSIISRILVEDSYINAAVITGKLVAATSTTAQVPAAASVTDDAYNGMTLNILSGTGAGQARVISDYDGVTQTATVPAWTTTPDSTSVFDIGQGVGIGFNSGLTGVHAVRGPHSIRGCTDRIGTLPTNVILEDDFLYFQQNNFNPSSLTTGAALNSLKTVPGARIGDRVVVTFDKDLLDGDSAVTTAKPLYLSGTVVNNSDIDNVAVILDNANANTNDLASGKLRIWVYRSN